ncbi:MAG: cyclic pyranopterin monophosphate synthase MoaC [Chloroflexi bacterium]|nr:cyclic pyranopterin monophosphate synthase MoaC [Chloroflexota bacterium]
MIELYTDGAFNPVTGQGGWAAVIISDERKQVFSGVAKGTTGNRMEITAALEGIGHLPHGAEATVYTDSQYLFGTMTRGWRRRANGDLWEQLDKASSQRKMYWQWINGDSANPYHEEAHRTANGLVGMKESEFHEVETGKQQPPEKPVLTHLDAAGRPRMVDVSAKVDTVREAVARGLVRMQPATFNLIKQGQVAKGDVLTVAQLAGVMGAKQTPSLIPLCHPLLIDDVKVELSLDDKNSTVEITSTVKSTGKTGVEMEALTATAVAALTIYDMCKAIDRGLTIESIRLVRKSGGKSGTIILE